MIDLHDYFLSNKVLFATNGWTNQEAIVNKSLQTYRNLTDTVYIVSSDKVTIYGRDAFLDIFKQGIDKGYRYVIYIDVDCFIFSQRNLQTEFEAFVTSGEVFSGPTDGGVICHRNCNRMSPNPFILFVNLEKLKETYNGQGFDFGDRNAYSIDKVSKETIAQWQTTVDAYAKYRKDKGLIVPHTQVISAQWNPDWNKRHYYTMKQIPWSYRDTPNGEPYYSIFLSYLERHGEGIRYMYAADYPFEPDPTGITTAVYCSKPDEQEDIFREENIICLHTWFSRLYDCSDGNPFKRYHNQRINAVANYVLSKQEEPE